MSSDVCVFLRPINITTSNKDFTVDGAAKALTQGTYATILNLMKEWNTQCPSHLMWLESNFKILITHNDAFTVTWNDTSLRDLLGFTGDLASSAHYHATYTPSHQWLPTYASYDRDRFSLKQDDLFRGVVTQDGNVAGISTGPDLYYRNLKFACESKLNVKMDAATNDYYKYRCFEYFAQQARTVQVGSASHTAAKGFYYFPDYTTVITMSQDSPITEVSGSGGVGFENSSSPNTYAFCQLDPDGPGAASASLPVGRSYYNIDFNIHTATAPSWNG